MDIKGLCFPSPGEVLFWLEKLVENPSQLRSHCLDLGNRDRQQSTYTYFTELYTDKVEGEKKSSFLCSRTLLSDFRKGQKFR